MEPGRVQEFELIPTGCILAGLGFVVGAVLGAIVGFLTSSPDDIGGYLLVPVFMLIGAVVGLVLGLAGGFLWWLISRFARRGTNQRSPRREAHSDD